jgi:hypothetical protein
MLVVQSEQEAAMIRDGNGAIWRRLKSASISLWRGPTDDSARDAEVLETLDAPEPRESGGGAADTLEHPGDAAQQRAGFSQHINC